MKTIRIGNNVDIRWTIMRDVEPENFEGKDVKVQLLSKCGCPQEIAYHTVDNIVYITFYGKNQTESGVYRLMLVENEGTENQAVLDYCDAFILSKTMKNKTISGTDSSSSIITETIELTSEYSTGETDYAAGDGINIEKRVISVDDTVARTEDLNALEVKLDTKADKNSVVKYYGYDNDNVIPLRWNKPTYFGTEWFDGRVQKGDLSIYEGKTYLNNQKLSDIIGGKADKSEIPTVPTNVSAFTNDAGYLTEHQDISNLATKTELNKKADKSSLSNYVLNDVFLDSINNLSSNKASYDWVNNNFATISSVNNRVAQIYDVMQTNDDILQNNINTKQDTLVSGTNIKTINCESILGSGNIEIQGGGGVTPEEVRSIVEGYDYATKSELPTVPTNVSAFNNDAGYISDVSNLATKDELNNKQDTLISGNNLATINGYDLLAGGNIEIQGGGIEEAPQDGYQYARQNGGWSIVQGGSGGGDVYSYGDNTFTGINIFNNNLNALGGLTVTDPRDGYQDSVFNILLYGHNYQGQFGVWVGNDYAFGQKIAYNDETGKYELVNDGAYNVKQCYVWNNINYIGSITNDYEAFYTAQEIDEYGNYIIKKVQYSSAPWYEYINEIYVNVPADYVDNDIYANYYQDAYNQSYLEANQFIKDAPYDGNQYARKDGSWQTIQIPESGVPEAPTDGNKYARQNGEWVSLGGDDYITVPIASYDDLVNAMNEYNSNADGLSKRYYYLENDIDCSDNYLPGFGTNTNAGVYFGNKCVFDGRLHKISNFKIQGSDNTAFFNNVSDAEIMNLYLETFEITGGAFTAALIGVQQRSGGAKIHDISIVNGTVTGGAQNAAAISGLFMANNSVMQNIYVENVQVSGSLESGLITGWKNEGTSIIRNIAIYNSTVSGTEYGRPLFRGNGSASFVYWNNPQGDTDYSGHSDINDSDITDGTLVNNLNSNLEINDWVQGTSRPEFNPLILKDLPVSTEVTTDKENRFTENNYFAKDIYEGGTKLEDKYALKSEITPTTPNVVKFGDVSIENGIMSNFSANNYAQFPFLVDLTNKFFEIDMEITTGGDVTNQQNILDSRDGLAFAIRNGQFVLAISSDGTSWAFEANGGTVEPNTTYLVKLAWDELYSVKYSTNNGASWITAINTEYLYSPYPRQILIGKDTTGNYVFGGQINLNKCTLSINGQYVWDGMADAGLLTRLDTSLSNIDADGVDKIKEIAGTSSSSVTSVNGQTGDVVLNIPTNVSELNNDVNFATTDYVDGRIPSGFQFLAGTYDADTKTLTLYDI